MNGRKARALRKKLQMKGKEADMRVKQEKEVIDYFKQPFTDEMKIVKATRRVHVNLTKQNYNKLKKVAYKLGTGMLVDKPNEEEGRDD